LAVCDAIHQSVAVVKAAADKCVDQCLGHVRRQQLHDAETHLAQLTVASPSDGTDVISSRQSNMDNNAHHARWQGTRQVG